MGFLQVTATQSTATRSADQGNDVRFSSRLMACTDSLSESEGDASALGC